MRAKSRALERYRPYPKQLEFHAAGLHHGERLFMAGNQLGKSYAGAAEFAMHVTGLYPDWWPGYRFDRPVMAWASGETSEAVRDTVQTRLIGPPENSDDWGTGSIPRDALVAVYRRTAPLNALDAISVRHVSGRLSTVRFKAYDQRRQRWQGPPVDLIWFDEEPPLDIYMEGITRTNATGGIAMMTFTPLLGISDVVRMYLTEADIQSMLEL